MDGSIIESLNGPLHFHGMVGGSPATMALVRRITGLAAGRTTVLIVGESGTGKELVARALHQAFAPLSPFVALNCAALPKDLIESELFGYVKGAFSGANQDQPGLFRSAHGGTLFLDEITEMNSETQAKLLRVIQERRVRPVGGMREVPVDVRIVASTNREPDEAVRDGYLRKDLYYRLAVGVLRAAPLRERRDDIAPLITHFIGLFNEKFAKHPPISAITPAALEALIRCPWPGNVRELSNAIEVAFAFCSSQTLTLEDFPLPAPSASAPARLAELRGNGSVATPDRAAPGAFSSLKEVERDHILWTLKKTGGNKALAARVLGISRKNLYDRLAQHGLGDTIRSAGQTAIMRDPVPVLTKAGY